MTDPTRELDARRVREARERLGLTQIELGRLLGVSNVTVNRWERGKSVPPRATLARLSILARHGQGSESVAFLQTERTGALPLTQTSFVGRDRDLSTLSELLIASPLVTLIGPGGAGKTRLAVETARQLASRFNGGVIFVDLAPLADSMLIEELTARLIAPDDESAAPARERILRSLQDRQKLIILDNCEHLHAPVALFAEWLTGASDSLRMLATSRIALGISAEHVHPVLPLSLDDTGKESAAVHLFLSRARTADPNFALQPIDSRIVLDICRRVDGLPLGIELAAARTPLLSIQQIRDRLGADPTLLHDRSRHSLRHRTLDNAIAWGVDLLTESDQRLFERLGIFTGSFDLEAVETLTGELSLPGGAIEGVAALVSRSMLVVDGGSGSPRRRYRLLETLRSYARTRLIERGEVETLRRRHAGYFLQLVARARTELAGPEQRRWFDLLEVDEDNIRAAMLFVATEPESQHALQFAAGLWRFWSVRGRIGEGRIWAERALEHADRRSTTLRAEVLNVAGNLANDQGDHRASVRWYGESLQAFRELGDRLGEARILSNLSIVSSMQGDYTASRERLLEALSIMRQIGESRILANVLHNLAVVEEHLGTLDLATEHYLESRSIFEQLGDQAGIATTLNNLGNLARGEGDVSRAEHFYREALQRREAIGDSLGIASCLHNLGVVARMHGDWDAAADNLEASLTRSRELGNQHGIANSLAMLGLTAVDRGIFARADDYLIESLLVRERLRERTGMAECFEGLAASSITRDPVRAARLFGAASREREELGEQIEPFTLGWLREKRDLLSRRFGTMVLNTEFDRGRHLSSIEALELALAASPTTGSVEPVTTRNGISRLSGRQREVLSLVARGNTNTEIARSLNLSKRTVESHLTVIYGELGVTSRSAAIALAHRHGIAGNIQIEPV